MSPRLRPRPSPLSLPVSRHTSSKKNNRILTLHRRNTSPRQTGTCHDRGSRGNRSCLEPEDSVGEIVRTGRYGFACKDDLSKCYRYHICGGCWTGCNDRYLRKAEPVFVSQAASSPRRQTTSWYVCKRMNDFWVYLFWAVIFGLLLCIWRISKSSQVMGGICSLYVQDSGTPQSATKVV